MNPEPEHEHHPTEIDRDRYLEHVLADTARFAAAVRHGNLDAPIAACPGWDLRALTAHQGMVQRWARHAAANAAPPESFDVFAPADDLDADALATWLEEGAAQLVATLRTIDLDGPTWHPFPVPRLGRVWPRRQAHEVSVHRWDAEVAAGFEPAAIDPELASDGIDEYFEVAIPRVVKREGITLPGGSIHLHCTDTHGEWLVTAEPDYTVVRAHQKGDAALRGPAQGLLLRLWGRNSPDADQLSPVGDEQVLAEWMALTGL